MKYLWGMYTLPYFKENDPDEVIKFIQKHSFIILCGCDPSGRPVATQVPVLVKEKDGKMILEGHVMKNTDHHLAFAVNAEVLAIFSGPHAYVSASWYSNPRQASTWNYMTVHARGILTFLDNHALLRILHETTSHFENDPASPASFDQLPEGYVRKLSKAIIAFQIEVSDLENVFKLSQNHEEENQKAIIEKLNGQDGDAKEIAREMQQRSYDSDPHS